MSTQVFAYEREDYDDRQYHSEYEESEYIEYNEYNYEEPLYRQDYKQKKSYSEYDNQYSKKPTKDKKFVWKTGQFEGFYVSSKVYCNLVISEGPTWASRSNRSTRSRGSRR